MRSYTAILSLLLFVGLLAPNMVYAQDYVGSETCAMCHNTVNTDLGYNIVEEYNKSGHPYKLNEVDGAPPTYPENTTPGVPNPPPGSSWDDLSYVIGGYGWKARFIKNDGNIYTAGEEAQYNLETEEWVAYHQDEIKPYNYGCFICHTTGPSEDGSWNSETADLGTFSEPGIRCEGCHGPGGDHASDPTGTSLPNQGDVLTIERCGECHQRGGATNAIPASGGYIKHHEQINEMRASAHGDGVGGELTCSSCHDAHIAGRYPQAAGEGLSAITVTCDACHPGHEVTINGEPKNINCVDCHMPDASKSAVGMEVGNGIRGDVATHIMYINTDPVPHDSMFTPDGGQVVLDEDGHAAVTLDFVCLRCHQDKTLEWAAEYAEDLHEGIVSVGDETVDLPRDVTLRPNFPNPFDRSTNVRFEIAEGGFVELLIFNAAGQKVKTLAHATFEAGVHDLTWNSLDDQGRLVAPGTYFCQLNMNGLVGKQRMILIK